jgi:hypothetical protein
MDLSSSSGCVVLALLGYDLTPKYAVVMIGFYSFPTALIGFARLP